MNGDQYTVGNRIMYRRLAKTKSEEAIKQVFLAEEKAKNNAENLDASMQAMSLDEEDSEYEPSNNINSYSENESMTNDDSGSGSDSGSDSEQETDDTEELSDL